MGRLSRRERRALAGLGQRLAEDDPALATRLQGDRDMPGRARQVVAVLFCGAVTILALPLHPLVSFGAFVLWIAATNRMLQRRFLTVRRVVVWLRRSPSPTGR